MTETTEAIGTITDVVARVAVAMEQAAIEHGAGAVDLALLAYQVEAIRGLMVGGLLVAPAVASVMVFRMVWRVTNDMCDEDPIRWLFSIVYGTLSMFLGLLGLVDLISPVRWMAALGSPELMIATKALKAGGLM